MVRIPSLYELACRAYNKSGETELGKELAWDELLGTPPHPDMVKPDLVLERVVSPPEEKYLRYPARHNPFLLRVAYVNPRGFTEGSVGVISLLCSGWRSGGCFPFRPPSAFGNHSAQEWLNRLEEMTRHLPPPIEQHWIPYADLGPGFSLGSFAEEAFMQDNYDTLFVSYIAHQEIEERAGRPIPPLPQGMPRTYLNPYIEQHVEDVRQLYRSP